MARADDTDPRADGVERFAGGDALPHESHDRFALGGLGVPLRACGGGEAGGGATAPDTRPGGGATAPDTRHDTQGPGGATDPP